MSRKSKQRIFKVVISGSAYVSTTYKLKASSPEEAEALAKSGDYECEDEAILEKTDTDCEVTEEKNS